MRNVALAVAVLAFTACAPANSSRRPTAPSVEHGRSERVVAALVPVVRIKGAPESRYRIDDRMKHFHVPGVSIAVVDDGAIVWARGFGADGAVDAVRFADIALVRQKP